MKTLPSKRNISGLTLIELVVVIAVIAILAALLLPATTNSPVKHGSMTQCLSNQRQIAVSLIIFEDDHAGKFPAQVSTANGGSLEIISNGSASAQFQTIASYLGNRLQALICPTDKTRNAATNFSGLKNENISYFLNLDAITNLNSVLTGDRNLELNSKPINTGVFVQTTNVPLQWAEGFHGSRGKPSGIFSFGDGHGQFIRAEELNLFLQRQPVAANRFCFP